MIPFNAFKSLIAIITGARQKETEEHQQFMEFYRELVKIVPDDVAKSFKSISVPTTVGNKVEKDYRLELTVTDFMWWESIVLKEGGRFVQSVYEIQRNIWDRLNTLVKDHNLTEEQRAAMLTLADDNV